MPVIFQTILFCMLIGCTKQPSHHNINNIDSVMNNNDSTNTAAHTWLALGDSYTIGESVKEEERFPAQTISILKSKNISFKTPEYIATTGWTTLNLLNAIAQQNPRGTYDVVSLLIGVNDQYQHFDTDSYRIHFRQCLQKAILLAGNKTDHVFVVSIPDYSVTPFAQNGDTAQIRKELEEFNAINKEITLSYNISYTDITPLTREAKADSSLIAGDGLHPSGKEYEKWAKMFAPEIEKVLK
ncbi:MAG TPA: SGNH/GDSL hydrolase family protein [Parafilimonas sp.]|nr:SGNH/GDSL hydrolase family protein [Parafilimonas sp.]